MEDNIWMKSISKARNRRYGLPLLNFISKEPSLLHQDGYSRTLCIEVHP